MRLRWTFLSQNPRRKRLAKRESRQQTMRAALGVWSLTTTGAPRSLAAIDSRGVDTIYPKALKLNILLESRSLEGQAGAFRQAEKKIHIVDGCARSAL